MLIRSIAIDDDSPALSLIREYVQQTPGLQLLHTFNDAISGAEFLRHTPVDLLFIDINMPDITGLDLVNSLQTKPMIIFTTAYKKFAIDGFELSAIDYLLKPFSLERFTTATIKAATHFRHTRRTGQEFTEHLYVYVAYRMMKIPCKDIEYIESLEDYIRIHLVEGHPVVTLMPLKKVLEKLPPEKFRRIHRSYVIATDKVYSVHNRQVRLTSGKQLPIGYTYLSFAREWKKC
jgi:two-component system LytT family response regulator